MSELTNVRILKKCSMILPALGSASRQNNSDNLELLLI